MTCLQGAIITPSASGGNGGPFSYELFDLGGVSQGTTTSTFTDVSAGTYTVVATDVSGSCTSLPATVTVSPIEAISFVAVVDHCSVSGVYSPSILVSNIVGNANINVSLLNSSGVSQTNSNLLATEDSITFSGTDLSTGCLLYTSPSPRDS